MKRIVRVVTSVLLCVGLALAGCAQIPRTGPLGTNGANNGADAALPPVLEAPAPREGMSPQEIVRGFIEASGTVRDDFVAARKFLSESFSPNWRPDTQTTLYAGDLKVSGTDRPETQTVEYSVTGSIDANGIRSQDASSTPKKSHVELVQENGQWRISQIDNGLLIGEKLASNVFQPHYLYFYNSTYDKMVPDVRWFLARPGSIATSVVSALLTGASPYLKDAVVSAFPEQARLSSNSVPLESGEAKVDLVAPEAPNPSPLQAQRMLQQLRFTLQALSSVNSTQLTLDQTLLNDQQVEGFRAASVSVPVGPTMVGINDENNIVLLLGQSANRVGNNTAVSKPAISYDASLIAALGAEGRGLYLVSTDGQSQSQFEGNLLSAPSFDQVTKDEQVQTYAWTSAQNSAPGTGLRSDVYAVKIERTDGMNVEPIKVAAPWLESESVQGLRVSRDGARALVVVDSGQGSTLYLAGIVRNDKGEPQRLSAPTKILSLDTKVSVAWSGPASFVFVKNPGAPEASLFRFDLNASEPQALSSLEGAIRVTAGNTSNEVFTSTAEEVFTLSGTNWSSHIKGVREASYAG